MSISDNVWFQTLKPLNKPDQRLICIPYAGGAASAFKSWQDGLPPGTEVSSVQLPGHMGRLSEPFLTELDTVVDRLVAELEQYVGECDYFIFGHSMGARVAYEVTARLADKKLALPKELFVSGAVAPQIPRRKENIHHLDDEAFCQEVVGMNGTPSGVMENRELRELMLPILRTDFKICETWENGISQVLPMPIRAFGGLKDTGVTTADIDAWRECTSVEFNRHLFPGDHFFIQPFEAKLLALISRYLYQASA